MAMRTGFYFDPISLQHETGNHPENAGRLKFLMEAIANNSELDALQKMQCRKAEIWEIQMIHELDYIRSVEEACAEGAQGW